MENQSTPAPENHLVKAILTLVFCCLPLGIVSLIYATKVDTLWAKGEEQEAINAANNANKWANISIIVGLIINVLYVGYTALTL